jgi:hypothetical protein
LQNKPSRVAEILAAAAAARGDAPLLEFRNERERLEFSIEMAVIDMRANLLRIREQLKLLEKFSDRP